MRTIETTVRVSPDHIMIVQLPPDISPGEYRVVVVIDDEAVKQREATQVLRLPVHNSGLVAPDLSLRREDMYGDYGR